MKQYIGTKIIQAEPCYKLVVTGTNVPGSYILLVQEEDLPKNEEAAKAKGWKLEKHEGYKVRYADGYESWSPKEVFEEAYRQTDCMSFGLAIEAVKQGKSVARKGWNGKNQFVELATCISYKGNAGEIVNCHHNDIGNKALAFVGTSGVQMGWLASQADMLADDWYIVE